MELRLKNVDITIDLKIITSVVAGETFIDHVYIDDSKFDLKPYLSQVDLRMLLDYADGEE